MTQTMDTPVRPVRRSVPALALLTLVGGLALAAAPTRTPPRRPWHRHRC
ncbi:hypothetical protein NKG05_03185 [Oerskovia sp. M15]